MKQCPPEGRCVKHSLGNAEAGFSCSGQEHGLARRCCSQGCHLPSALPGGASATHAGIREWIPALGLAEPARLSHWQCPVGQGLVLPKPPRAGFPVLGRSLLAVASPCRALPPLGRLGWGGQRGSQPPGLARTAWCGQGARLPSRTLPFLTKGNGWK